MLTHLSSTWEIMPQAVTVCTGDVHIDGNDKSPVIAALSLVIF